LSKDLPVFTKAFSGQLLLQAGSGTKMRTAFALFSVARLTSSQLAQAAIGSTGEGSAKKNPSKHDGLLPGGTATVRAQTCDSDYGATNG
jgi:hypothetical protein